MSWKPEVLIYPDGWLPNQLCFATKEEAEDNASFLMDRWYAVHDCRAVESTDPVKHIWDFENKETKGI